MPSPSHARIPAVACGLLLLCSGASLAGAEPGPAKPRTFWSQLEEGGPWGKLSLNLRVRMERADVEPLSHSQAYTVRTRLGYRTPTWQGLSAFVEGEAINAFSDRSDFFDAASRPNGESPIADPEDLGLNQLYLRYARADTQTQLTAGRQRIILDNARFVGNVGFRQNEQTYDAASISSSLGIEGLTVFYGFIWDVHRIFGDNHSAPAANRDFDGDLHLLNASYQVSPALRVTGFAYLLDFDERAAFTESSNSFGLRLAGGVPLGGALKLDYQASYAYQTDAGDNPVDYHAPYLQLESSLAHAGLGAIGLGYEVLGSDSGRANFRTPLATLHAFNGFVDAFLDNGGPDGLRDFYAFIAPPLPFGLKGKVIYHRFQSDDSSSRLGTELDAVVRRAINDHLALELKWAYFNGEDEGPSDRWRFFASAELSF